LLRENINLVVSDSFCEEFDKKICQPYRINGKCWKINGEFHRTLGPALVFNKKEYFIRGIFVGNFDNEKQYRRWVKLRIFE
jgi:hypothetical protein